jgi:hypothetical protein
MNTIRLRNALTAGAGQDQVSPGAVTGLRKPVGRIAGAWLRISLNRAERTGLGDSSREPTNSAGQTGDSYAGLPLPDFMTNPPKIALKRPIIDYTASGGR